MEFKLPTRVTSTPWWTTIRRFREDAGMSRHAMCRRTGFRVQDTSLKKYEEGTQTPSINRFIELIEAAGGVVIVRHGTTEYHVISEG